MLRVLLADDQAWLRSALRFLLEQESGVEVIGEAGDARVVGKGAKHAPQPRPAGLGTSRFIWSGPRSGRWLVTVSSASEVSTGPAANCQPMMMHRAGTAHHRAASRPW